MSQHEDMPSWVEDFNRFAALDYKDQLLRIAERHDEIWLEDDARRDRESGAPGPEGSPRAGGEEEAPQQGADPSDG